MNSVIIINSKYCFRADNIQARLRSLVPTWILFLQGVLHSSSLPDYIEDKKSGGQKTDRLINTSLCNVTTNIIGREARKGRMLKTVNIVTLIGTL
jgi:hypothetical protein